MDAPQLLEAPAPRTAGFWSRVAAMSIDFVVLGVLQGLLAVARLGSLAFPLHLAYFVYFWSTDGQTPGMRLIGVRVVRTDGAPLTIGTGVLRYIGYFISALCLGLGLLWVGWDERKQGWHDKIAGTYVVETRTISTALVVAVGLLLVLFGGLALLFFAFVGAILSAWKTF